VLFLRRLGMRRHFLAVSLSLLATGLYTLLVGAGASVVRAAIMGVLGLFAVEWDAVRIGSIAGPSPRP